MPDPDAPARNDDGTLKDASELEFVHSPSDEQPRIRPLKEMTIESDDNSDLPVRLRKGKEPARIVGGKRVPKVSARAKASADHASAAERHFFTSSFISKILSFTSVEYERILQQFSKLMASTVFHFPLSVFGNPV